MYFFILLHLPFLWCFKCTIKTENLQMCKKEKYEKHRNVLVFFFPFAMLVIPNFQKLSLGTRSIFLGAFLVIPFQNRSVFQSQRIDLSLGEDGRKKLSEVCRAFAPCLQTRSMYYFSVPLCISLPKHQIPLYIYRVLPALWADQAPAFCIRKL